MTPGQELVRETERLRRLAAAAHVHYPPAEATREQVADFAREAGVAVGEDLLEFWVAGEGFVLMVPTPAPRPFEATPFRAARRAWFGYEQEVTTHFGPRTGQAIRVRVGGTGARGLVDIGSDGSGDELYLALAGGPAGKPGQVLHHDHETDTYTAVAENLPAFLKASNDFVESDPDRAFFRGDAVSRIFRFPGVDELHRQLDAGLSPDHVWRGGAENLLGEALDKRRDDVFAALLERGANRDVALAEALRRRRLDLAEGALKRGANPAAPADGGWPLLAWAARGGLPRATALLMRYGARDRLPAGEFARIVEEVSGSNQIDERKRRQVLEALGQAAG